MTSTTESPDTAAVEDVTGEPPAVAAATPAGPARGLRGWMPLLGIAVLGVYLLAVAPATLNDFRLGNLGKYCCYAMAAVGIGLAWGRGGMLVLGQGLYFGLGGYAMAMHLKLEAAGPGAVPDFMQLYAGGQMPGWWEPFRSGAFTIAVVVLLPALVATVLGVAIFKRGVQGAYFAILSQALAAAFAVLIIGQIEVTGGFNGLSGFTSWFGYSLYDPINQRLIYTITAGLLVAMMVAAWLLTRSRYGELLVAVRDAEARVRFLGHDPANIKLVAYVAAAVMAGIGGAMFVPLVGIISPLDIDAIASIGLIAGVALGGRATILGPALGALAVGYLETSLSEQFPGSWSYFQGALFIVVVLLLPGGLAQIPSLAGRLRRTRPSSAEGVAA